MSKTKSVEVDAKTFTFDYIAAGDQWRVTSTQFEPPKIAELLPDRGAQRGRGPWFVFPLVMRDEDSVTDLIVRAAARVDIDARRKERP